MTRICCGCGSSIDDDRLPDAVIDEDDDGSPLVACSDSCMMAFWAVEDALRDAVHVHDERELREANRARDRAMREGAEDFDPIAEDTDD